LETPDPSPAISSTLNLPHFHSHWLRPAAAAPGTLNLSSTASDIAICLLCISSILCSNAVCCSRNACMASMDDLLLLLAPLKFLARLPQHTEHKTQHSTTQTQHNKVFCAEQNHVSSYSGDAHTQISTTTQLRLRMDDFSKRENTQQSLGCRSGTREHTAVVPSQSDGERSRSSHPAELAEAREHTAVASLNYSCWGKPRLPNVSSGNSATPNPEALVFLLKSHW